MRDIHCSELCKGAAGCLSRRHANKDALETDLLAEHMMAGGGFVHNDPSWSVETKQDCTSWPVMAVTTSSSLLLCCIGFLPPPRVAQLPAADMQGESFLIVPDFRLLPGKQHGN